MNETLQGKEDFHCKRSPKIAYHSYSISDGDVICPWDSSYDSWIDWMSSKTSFSTVSAQGSSVTLVGSFHAFSNRVRELQPDWWYRKASNWLHCHWFLIPLIISSPAYKHTEPITLEPHFYFCPRKTSGPLTLNSLCGLIHLSLAIRCWCIAQWLICDSVHLHLHPCFHTYSSVHLSLIFAFF